jgi:hypothetical protein
MTALVRSMGLIGAAAVAALTLTACGGSTASNGSAAMPTAATSSAPAPASTSSAPTKPTPSPSGATVSASDITSLLKHAFAMRSAHFVQQFRSSTGVLEGTTDGDIQLNPTAVDLTLSGSGAATRARVVAVGGVDYIKTSSIGTGWYRFDPAKVGMSTDVSDPSALLARLSKAIDSATYVGTDSIGRHYRLIISGAAYAAEVPDESSALAHAGQTLPPHPIMDVWFNRAGYLAKLTGSLGGQGTLTQTYSKFNEPITIESPPASQVKPLPSAPASAGS